MIAYAESSAVLSRILGKPEGDIARKAFADAERVVSSTLAQVECSRALTRAVGLGRLGRGEELAVLRLLDAAAARWAVLEMSGKVLARARGAFPVEPVRTFDALHLATALQFREAMPDLVVISLDDRVRANALALALPVLP